MLVPAVLFSIEHTVPVRNPAHITGLVLTEIKRLSILKSFVESTFDGIHQCKGCSLGSKAARYGGRHHLDALLHAGQSLLKMLDTIESTFNKGLKYAEPFYLRQHEPGDMGWVTHRHGVLYAEEYGWDEHFEALVAQIVADFINNYNPERERCWIAEMNGEIVGSIFVVQASESVAKLRLLLVEPRARGMGLGMRLVEECIRFARKRGYQKLVLWTNDILVEARHIYSKTGFKLVAREASHSYGHDLVGETWELVL